MKALAVEQLYEYGQALYQRGDYSQAAVIFNRILAMDPSNKGAVDTAKLLNQKGQSITIPLQAEIAMPAVDASSVNAADKGNNFGNIFQGKVADTKVIEPLPEVTPATIDMSGANLDLKKDIQETDVAIEQLKNELAQLRTQIANGQQELNNSKK